MLPEIDIELKNYRCFADSDPARFTLRPGTTALVGKNNCGKSTLLRSMYELRGLLQLVGDSSELRHGVVRSNGHRTFSLATLIAYVNGRQYGLAELGSGVAQFLILLVSAAVKRPSYVLIDEPELNLHSSLQSDFLTTLASYATHGVVFATHSLGLARSSATSVYSLQRDADGPVSLRPFEASARPSELVGALSFTNSPALGFDRILLVESPTDGLALQQLLRRKGKDHQVLTIPLGGSTLINGSSTAELQLDELKRITPRISAIVDSERLGPTDPLPAERQAFSSLCGRLGIPCHLTTRRAIENYFSQGNLDRAFGPGRTALGPYDPLPAGAWPKALNWRAAREMSDAELDATDLGPFLDQA
jgi:ABC-type cobalamin/Fe3+-siderophores transport system ATPase subunit